MNKKSIRKLSVALVFSILVTFLFSMNVFAADKYVAKTMPIGETVAVTSQSYASGSYTYTMYKFTVPSGKYVELSCVPVSGKKYSTASFYSKANAGSSYRVGSLSDKKSTGKTWTGRFAMEPGTYYVSFSDVAKAKLTLLTSPNKANYCKAKAISLASGKVATVVQTPDIDYSRWYKISLTKAQTLKISANTYPNVYVYTKSGAKVNLGNYTTTTGYLTSTSKLAKGTYYICIRANNYVASTNTAYDKKGDYLTFKWN